MCFARMRNEFGRRMKMALIIIKELYDWADKSNYYIIAEDLNHLARDAKDFLLCNRCVLVRDKTLPVG